MNPTHLQSAEAGWGEGEVADENTYYFNQPPKLNQHKHTLNVWADSRTGKVLIGSQNNRAVEDFRQPANKNILSEDAARGGVGPAQQ